MMQPEGLMFIHVICQPARWK